MRSMKAFLKKIRQRSKPALAEMSKIMMSHRYKLKHINIKRRVSITTMMTLISKSIIASTVNLTEFMKDKSHETLIMNHMYKSRRLMSVCLTCIKCKNLMLKIVIASKILIKFCHKKLIFKRNPIFSKTKLLGKKLSWKKDSQYSRLTHLYLKIRLDYCPRMTLCQI